MLKIKIELSSNDVKEIKEVRDEIIKTVPEVREGKVSICKDKLAKKFRTDFGIKETEEGFSLEYNVPLEGLGELFRHELKPIFILIKSIINLRRVDLLDTKWGKKFTEVRFESRRLDLDSAMEMANHIVECETRLENSTDYSEKNNLRHEIRELKNSRSSYRI